MNEKFVKNVRESMDCINQSGYGFSVISDDYVNDIFDLIEKEVAEDIYCTAGFRYNDSDVRLAVGRVISKRLGLQV